MTSLPDISGSEWSVMEALWESSPQTASELTKTLRPTMNWAENTVRTLLTRLIDKGAITTGENSSGTRTYLPAVGIDGEPTAFQLGNLGEKYEDGECVDEAGHN